ncbi:unnamed protein product [Cuscuta campestris]|uniref:Uncharacterized protein n=1 Tax=Cuscuta campestris TaxID=132261 RepID=A0A484NIM8_9ASTE|nr:unnamed protein product [Cuscuta campestris]
MGRISAPADASSKRESESEDALWSEEHERLPLKQRIKLLLASNRFPNSELGMAVISEPPANVFVKSYNSQCYSQEEKIDCFKVQQNDTGERKEDMPRAEGDECMCQLTADDIMFGKVDAANDTLLPQTFSPQHPIKTNDSNANPLKNSTQFSSGSYMETVKIKNEIPNVYLDDLDFVILKERKRMLLSRKSPSLERKTVEGTLPTLSSLVEDCFMHGNGIGKGDDRDFHIAGGHYKTSDLSKYDQTRPEQESLHELDLPSHSSNTIPAMVNVKVEPLERIEFDTTGKHAAHDPSCNFSLPMKREVHFDSTINKHATGIPLYKFFLPLKKEVPCDSIIDELDHMPLRERLKLSSQNVITSSGGNEISASFSKTVPSKIDYTPIASAAAKTKKIYLSRKRRKTTTDSIEQALEEDAPGLLKVLLEKGVSADEIKLYGEPESNESLDDLSTEDSFSELEEIVSKLFSQRHSMLKIHSMHNSKGEKACYCLACLFSLVEQARYLKLRKWPVEWGWCRDLQSFIFVFERHNRIVLERPEYGYATYFFELVESIPINWQIKRLITAMKLTSCSRVSLLENRALLVGEDVTEGEARVLVGYGWTPNTGLGSMLNYCDRVVHDRRQREKDSSEWRSKIGKMLIDGYNGGKFVPVELPSVLARYDVADDTKVKMELDDVADHTQVKLELD